MIVYPVEYLFMVFRQIPVGIGELCGYPGVEFAGLLFVLHEQQF